jgi:hypothetical protein
MNRVYLTERLIFVLWLPRERERERKRHRERERERERDRDIERGIKVFSFASFLPSLSSFSSSSSSSESRVIMGAAHHRRRPKRRKGRKLDVELVASFVFSSEWLPSL